MHSKLLELPLTEAGERLRRKAVTSTQLTRACLERIQRLNPALNVFITVTAEAALAAARQADGEIARGRWRGPLHGVPLALKDLIDTAGVPTTAASALFKDRVPREDAEVVRRLKAAGAVILGKLNLHEFAYGGSGIVSHYGPVQNPWKPAYITGGSSSGSAAAVAAGLCFGALGTDTAGSIRLPAACCGIVGLKPTYGLVSARGVIPLAGSLDHVGPMTRTVADAAVILQAIAGYDPQDIGSRELPACDYAAETGGDTESLRLGVPRAFFFEEIDAEIESCVEDAIKLLGKLAASTKDVNIPVENDPTVATAEAYAYHEPHLKEHADLYQPETLRRIRKGAEISAATYIQKRRELEQLRRGAGSLFRDVDALVTPTSPVLPPTIAELEADAANLRRRELVMLRNTRPFNLLGLPAISVPCGFTKEGLPVGLQIIGPPAGEAVVLRLAAAYERVTEWHKRRPKL
jgi:aspartyl-tRNA(Asn)/glutamyl-tRNA(Gln) amidotransferase subunit A